MAGIEFDTHTGELFVNGVTMHCAAWNVIDLTRLYLPSEQRGADRLIVGVRGLRPYQNKDAETSYRFPMVLSGEADRLGVSWEDNALASPFAQLKSNIDYLSTNVLAIGAGDGTQPATLNLPDGDVRTADINRVGITQGATFYGTNARTGVVGVGQTATFDFTIPDGEFR